MLIVVVTMIVAMVVVAVMKSQAELVHSRGSLAVFIERLKLISEVTKPRIHSCYVHRDQEGWEGGTGKGLAHLPRV